MLLYYISTVLPVIAVLALLIYLPLFFIKKKIYGRRPLLRHLAIYGYIGVVLSILYATLLFTGIRFQTGQLNLVPFIWVEKPYAMGRAKMAEQLVLNLVMTIPLGFFLPAVFQSYRNKWWKTVLHIAIFIACVETFQYFIGRSADVDDWILNTLGGALGCGIWRSLDKRWSGRPLWNSACSCANAA